MGTARRAIPFPLPEDLTGCKIGRFAIRSRLGAGGMGDVYYADDMTLQRPVALKRVARRLGNDPEARRRILREAQRASALNSERIASIHDVLEEGGEVFVVMEYVEGETLRQRLRRPITLEVFFQIATQCAEALIVAHECGVIHCDIKPENIMLTPACQVKILDFGLAKHLPRSDQSSTLEYSGVVGGTPAYMAPEVLLEKSPDACTDIFSLGVVLYEMLTLRHPFFTSSFVATSERILHETPAAIRTFTPNIPEGVDAIVMKAMAKAPSQRYSNARELLADLQLVRAGTTPRNLAPAVPLRKERKRKHWALAAILAASVIAAVVASQWWMGREPVLAERGWVLISDFETGESAIPGKAVREGLTITLQQSRYINVFPRTRAYEVLQRMKKSGAVLIDESLGREICQRENLQVLLVGSIAREGRVFQITARALDPVQGRLLFAERERFDREEQFFARADALAKKVRKDFGESLVGIEKTSRPLAKVTTNSLEALQLYSQAKDASDRGENEQVLVMLNGALRLDPNFAMAHLRLGQYYLAVVGKNQRALAEVERAYGLRNSVTERELRRIEAEYYNLQERDEDEVQALSILVNLYPDDEEAHYELAGAYYNLNQLDKAVRELRQVLRMNPSSAPAYRDLTLYLARSNQAEAAIAASREAEQRGVDSAQMHWGLGLAYLGQSNVPMARQEFHRIGQGTQTDRELQELCLAVADLYEGKLDKAKAALSEQIQTTPAPKGGLQTFRHYLLGRIHLSQGNSRRAEIQADLILQTPSTGLQTSDLLNAGVLYARTGKIRKAQLTLRRIDDSRKAFPSSSNEGNLHNLEGEIWLADAKPAEAEKSLITAVQEYPQVFSHEGLARAYQAQKHWNLAAEQWEQVLRSRGETLQNGFPPDLAYAHLQLARVYRRLSKPDLAHNHYQEVLQMWKDADDLRFLRVLKRELHE